MGSSDGIGKSANDSASLVRRPVHFWKPFNDWWRAALEESGRRPLADEIWRWYTNNALQVWGDADQPTLQECRTHAKCLRSVAAVRSYFRKYRERRTGQGTKDCVSEDEDEDQRPRKLSVNPSLSHGLQQNNKPLETASQRAQNTVTSPSVPAPSFFGVTSKPVVQPLWRSTSMQHPEQNKQQPSANASGKRMQSTAISFSLQPAPHPKEMSILKPPLSASTKCFVSKPSTNQTPMLLDKPSNQQMAASQPSGPADQQLGSCVPYAAARNASHASTPAFPRSSKLPTCSALQAVLPDHTNALGILLPQLAQVKVRPSLSRPGQAVSASLQPDPGPVGTPVGLMLDSIAESPGFLDIEKLLSEQTPTFSGAWAFTGPVSPWMGSALRPDTGVADGKLGQPELPSPACTIDYSSKQPGSSMSTGQPNPFQLYALLGQGAQAHCQASQTVSSQQHQAARSHHMPKHQQASFSPRPASLLPGLLSQRAYALYPSGPGLPSMYCFTAAENAASFQAAQNIGYCATLRQCGLLSAVQQQEDGACCGQQVTTMPACQSGMLEKAHLEDGQA